MITIKFNFEIYEQNKNLNIGDFTYKTIRDNIINWNLKPGTMMSEKEVSLALSVSRTPVREAFIKMSKEGLVDIMPQRGTIVSKIDLNRVEEERFIRESIELAVFNVAVDELTEEVVIKLENNIKSQAKSIEENNLMEFFQLDEEFHKNIFLACGKELSWEVIQNVSGHYKRMRVMTLWDNKLPNGIFEQHKTLLQCIKNKEVDKTQHIIKKHLSKLKDEELEMKSVYPDYFL